MRPRRRPTPPKIARPELSTIRFTTASPIPVSSAAASSETAARCAPAATAECRSRCRRPSISQQLAGIARRHIDSRGSLPRYLIAFDMRFRKTCSNGTRSISIVGRSDRGRSARRGRRGEFEHVPQHVAVVRGHGLTRCASRARVRQHTVHHRAHLRESTPIRSRYFGSSPVAATTPPTAARRTRHHGADRRLEIVRYGLRELVEGRIAPLEFREHSREARCFLSSSRCATTGSELRFNTSLLMRSSRGSSGCSTSQPPPAARPVRYVNARGSRRPCTLRSTSSPLRRGLTGTGGDHAAQLLTRRLVVHQIGEAALDERFLNQRLEAPVRRLDGAVRRARRRRQATHRDPREAPPR